MCAPTPRSGIAQTVLRKNCARFSRPRDDAEGIGCDLDDGSGRSSVVADVTFAQPRAGVAEQV